MDELTRLWITFSQGTSGIPFRFRTGTEQKEAISGGFGFNVFRLKAHQLPRC
jgi:hypothetical protein